MVDSDGVDRKYGRKISVWMLYILLIVSSAAVFYAIGSSRSSAAAAASGPSSYVPPRLKPQLYQYLNHYYYSTNASSFRLRKKDIAAAHGGDSGFNGVSSASSLNRVSNVSGESDPHPLTSRAPFEIETEKLEQRLARARAAIQKAALVNHSTMVASLRVYHNPASFFQSHKEMQKYLRIWVYKDGDTPLFHSAPMKDIYSIEGHFLDEMERGKSPFLALHPREATAFFLPVGITNIITYLYTPRLTCKRDQLQNVLTDYIATLSRKYPYWNRSQGADHFYVGCHDWAPDVTAADPKLYHNLIRVLCNANKSEGFRPARDVSLPEIKVPAKDLGPPLLGQPPGDRRILAFFAGGPHGYVRKLIFQHWKDKDEDVQVHQYLPKNVSYFEFMGSSKFCLCPSGYEVASPRIVESIHAGCVPVTISDGYVLPFSDVLDWSQFSVHIPVSKIPEIKRILEGISMDEYLRKQKHVMDVQRHFVLHRPAQAFDLLHMVLHSIWLRRLNVKLPYMH